MLIPTKDRVNCKNQTCLSRFAKHSLQKLRLSKQLRWYMALTGSQRGVLIRLYINAKTKENENDLMGFVETVLEMSTAEMEAERKLLEKKARNYQAAVESQNPSMAEHIANDGSLNRQCRICPYAVECYQINKVHNA